MALYFTHIFFIFDRVIVSADFSVAFSDVSAFTDVYIKISTFFEIVG